MSTSMLFTTDGLREMGGVPEHILEIDGRSLVLVVSRWEFGRGSQDSLPAQSPLRVSDSRLQLWPSLCL